MIAENASARGRRTAILSNLREAGAVAAAGRRQETPGARVSVVKPGVASVKIGAAAAGTARARAQPAAPMAVLRNIANIVTPHWLF
jgi:hypothetical protein